jgi:hypothetical protein
MAPYFLVMQADAMLGGNKKELKKQAMLLFDQARSLLPKTSPLSYLYATKQALVSIDTYEGNSDNADESWGVDQLKKLAIDAKNPQRDVALYYLGLYYSSKNQADQATATWKELVALHEGQKTASPWASRAQAALQ